MPKAPDPPKPKFNPRLWLRIAFWSAIFAGAAYGAKEVHSFLLADPRFDFSAPEIRGVVYTDRARIQAVFVPDAHRSVFHLPLAELRRHLLAIDWEQTASIERVCSSPIRISR